LEKSRVHVQTLLKIADSGHGLSLQLDFYVEVKRGFFRGLIGLVSIRSGDGRQAVLPDPPARGAGALEVEVPGDPVLPHGGALADRPGDCHLSPVAFCRFGDRAAVGIEMIQSISEHEAGLRLRLRKEITVGVGEDDGQPAVSGVRVSKSHRRPAEFRA